MREDVKMGIVTTKKVIKELKKVKKSLNKKYKIERMLLFGSRARGDELLTSDADVMVVSSDFEKIPFHQRPGDFLMAWMIPVDLEILCYTPQELKRKQKEIGLVREALKQAVEI